MPNRATMSPAAAISMSSISSACMRTSRPTRTSLPRAGVEDRVALAQRALVDADVGQLAEAALLELEGQGDERLFGIDADRVLHVASVEVDRLVVDLGRVGQVTGHRVEQRLHALVLVGRADEDRRRARGRACRGGPRRGSAPASPCPRAPPRAARRRTSTPRRAVPAGAPRPRSRRSSGISASRTVLAVVAVEVERLHRRPGRPRPRASPRARSGSCISTALSLSFSRSSAVTRVGVGAGAVHLVDEREARHAGSAASAGRR